MFTFTNEWNRVSLAEGQFYTRLYRVIAETQFNPRIALVNNVQYDSQSAVIGWQSRFRWIVKPGNDLYFVYIHNWLDDPLVNRTYTLDRRLSSKFCIPTGSDRQGIPPSLAQGGWFESLVVRPRQRLVQSQDRESTWTAPRTSTNGLRRET